MSRIVARVSLALVLLGPVVSGLAAEGDRKGVPNRSARERATKDCHIYLHDGLEALGEHRDAEAKRWLKQALDAAETVGPDSAEMAQALSGLGALALEREKYTEAESLLARALAIREKVLGPDDVELGQLLHNLAATKMVLKKLDEAEPIARRALAIREKAEDADGEDLADTLDHLALIYAMKDQTPRAEEVFRRAVEVREKAQGPDHPDLAKALMNMAGARCSRAISSSIGARIEVLAGKRADGANDPSEAGFRAAEDLMGRALAIREKSLGPEHPKTIETLEELAACYGWHDDHVHADPLLLRLLAIREQTLGPDDPKVAESLAELAGRNIQQGRYREAEARLRRALAIQEKASRAKPDDNEAKETKEAYAQELRKAARSAEVMEDPKLRPTSDDLTYLNGLQYATREPSLASLFNSDMVHVLDDSIGDAGLVHLRGLVNAKSLQVSAEKITDAGLVHLERLTGLKELILIGSKIKGPGLARLKGMTDLEDLNLGASFLLDDAGLVHLPALPRLKKVNLDHTKISDAGLASLERLPALEELNVDGTKVTHAGLARLRRLRPGLKIVHTTKFVPQVQGDLPLLPEIPDDLPLLKIVPPPELLREGNARPRPDGAEKE